MTNQWELYACIAILAIPLLACAIRYTRARRRRSLANIYGYSFHTCIKQPQYRENVRRMG